MTGTAPGAEPTALFYRIDEARHRVTVVGIFARSDAYHPR